MVVAVMSDGSNHHRQAALALLTQHPDLPHRAAGFLGHVCVAPALTPKQQKWLCALLEKHGLPELAGGGAP
jgi:hypothetical protein